MLVEELRGAGGMERMDDFTARSWGGLGRSWRSFCLIFSPSFFTSIFHRFFSRFWWGLGGVLGSQKALKIDIWGVLGAMLFETLFSTIFPSIFVKIDGEKRQDV